jgi:sugar phosphate isomerase/epimerase
VPLRSIVQTLRQAGYDGCYDIELIGEEIEASDYRSLLLESKQFAESLL